jgi:hypothetical protein
VSVQYLDLAGYLAIAAEITGLNATTNRRVTNLHLADPAPHAPAAAFGDTLGGRIAPPTCGRMMPGLGNLCCGDVEFAQTPPRRSSS